MYINKGKKISNALFLPAELERGTKVLKFDVCCKTIDQNSDCGCNHYTILHYSIIWTHYCSNV